jgi:RNA polymerase sigma factor (sigma-70 family)
MFCTKCGSELLEGSTFCSRCGARVEQPHGAKGDAELERLAALGDRQAFGVLYERHSDRVYDFLLRMVGDPDEASDLMQETFLRAMRALSPEEKGAAFLTWALTIARNLALTRLERRKRTVTLAEREGDEEAPIFDQVDPDRLAQPEAAAEAREMSGLVWEAATGLSPKERSLLLLHVRQGLDSAEIAQVLGVSKGNAYTMISRLKDTFESAVASLFMLRVGRRDCPELNRLLGEQSITALSPTVRKLMESHVADCEGCRERRRKLVSPANILGAFAAVPLPLVLRQRVAEALAASWTQAGTHAATAGIKGLLSQPAAKLSALSTAWKAGLIAGALTVAVGGGLGAWVGVTGGLPGAGGNEAPKAAIPVVAGFSPTPTPSTVATLAPSPSRTITRSPTATATAKPSPTVTAPSAPTSRLGLSPTARPTSVLPSAPTATPTAAPGSSPARIVFTRGGNLATGELWAIDSDGSRLALLAGDIHTHPWGGYLRHGYNNPHISPRRDKVAFIGSDGNVWVVDAEDGDLERLSSEAAEADETFCERYVMLAEWAPDEKRIIYYVDSPEGETCQRRLDSVAGFYVADLESGTKTHLPELPNFVAWLDTQRVIFEQGTDQGPDYSKRWHTFDVSTRETQELTKLPFECFNVQESFSHVDNKLVYECDNLGEGSKIVHANIDNTARTVLLEGEWGELGFPNVSPSGTAFVFNRYRPIGGGQYAQDLCHYDLASGGETLVMSGFTSFQEWLDDTRVVVLESTDGSLGAPSTLYVVDVITGGKVALAEDVDFG